MENYAKIFRKYKDNSNLDISLDEYNPDDKKYKDLIIEKKKNNFKQVIINSELMVDIIKETLSKEGIIQNIDFTENTDYEINEDVKKLLWKLRDNKIYFDDLKILLSWVIDKNSIDIKELCIYYKNNQYSIYSNGIIKGSDIKEVFKIIVEPAVRRYLQ